MMNEWIVSSSLLIGAVLLGRWLLRGKISLRLQYALWAVVLLRLLLPMQLFTSTIGAGSIAQDVDISEPVRQVYTSVREDAYEREYSAAYSQVVAEYQASGQTYEPIVIERQAAAQAKEALELDLSKLLLGIWFAGMGVMTAVIAGCNVHLGRKLRRGRQELPVSDSLLPVYVTGAVPTPCIFGLFHPAIYLTPEAAGEGQVRSHVLAHELTHYRHLDHIWSVLRSVCLILHWYNPLVWIAAKVSRADAELACDEGALAQLGETHRADYGRTLIGLTCEAPIGDLFVAATTMTGSAGSIRERIRLLMKRPRNTVLALIAVVLVGTIVVGCSFAGAPETTEPTETTGPSADAPDNPGVSDFVTADGLLVFPGTRWGMTEAELLDALNIQEYGILSGLRGIHLPDTTFCGYPASIVFYFAQYRTEDEWGLSGVRVQLQEEEAADGVYDILCEQLGKSDFWTSGVTSFTWLSETLMEDVISPEAYAIYQENTVETAFSGAASSITWFGSGIPEQENVVSFSSDLGLARQIEASLAPDPTEAARASFTEPSNLEALTQLWNGWTGFSENEFVPAFTPEILDCVAVSEDCILVYYRRPGQQQIYAAQMMPHEDGWAVTANSLVISKPDGARDLTAEEITQVTVAFLPNVMDEVTGVGAACMVNDYYDDVTKLDRSELLAYFPGGTEGTEREFELLKAKYPDFFENWTWEDMPIPIHRYDPKTINSVLKTYADIRWEDLAWDEDLHYLEETGCFYNYTSDFGLFGFRCTGGWVTDKGAVLLSDYSALYLTERNGDYLITAHLPAMTMPTHSSNPMIPADARATITAEIVGEEFPYRDSYLCGEPSGITGIGIVPFERLTDVRFGQLEWSEDGWQMDKILYTTTLLESGWSFLAEVVFWGDTTTYGFSFTDASGAERHFALSISGEDGSLVLTEYAPKGPSADPELAITHTVAALMQAYEENINLNRDNAYDLLTVLSADPEHMVRHQGRKLPLSDFYGNIEYFHGKEAYWKHVRKDAGILPETFRVTSSLRDFRFEGDTAVVQAKVGMTFYYKGLDAPGGMGTYFEILLVRVDDAWLVADLTERNDWFDAEYKNDPNFDPDALIASYTP